MALLKAGQLKKISRKHFIAYNQIEKKAGDKIETKPTTTLTKKFVPGPAADEIMLPSSLIKTSFESVAPLRKKKVYQNK